MFDPTVHPFWGIFTSYIPGSLSIVPVQDEASIRQLFTAGFTHYKVGTHGVCPANTDGTILMKDAIDAMNGTSAVPTAIKDVPLAVPVTTPSSALTTPRVTDIGKLSVEAVSRITSDDNMLATLGLFRPGGNVATGHTAGGYRPGTTALDSAYAKLASGRLAWDAKPLVEDALMSVVDAITAEDREDLEVSLRDVRMSDDGTLNIPGEPAYGMEMRGLATLLTRIPGWNATTGPTVEVPVFEHGTMVAVETHPITDARVFPSAIELMLALPPDERAWVFNRGMSRANQEYPLVVRTRQGPDGRGVYACVSQQYSPFDADEVATVLQESLHGRGFKGDVRYEASTTSLYVDALYHADAKTRDFAAGDVFQVGMRFKSNDSAGGSIRGFPVAWWNGCLNMIVVSKGEGTDMLRIVHKGALMTVSVDDMVSNVADALEPFAKRWGILRTRSVSDVTLWGERFTSVEQALAWGVHHKHLDVGMARDVGVQALLESNEWAGKPQDLSAIVNAVTRAAHVAYLDEFTRDRVERAAGMLVPVLARAAQA